MEGIDPESIPYEDPNIMNLVQQVSIKVGFIIHVYSAGFKNSFVKLTNYSRLNSRANFIL